MTCENQEGTAPVFFVSECSQAPEGTGHQSEVDGAKPCASKKRKAPNSTTNPLTATALIYAFGAGITAGAGTRLVLQLLLDFGWV